MKIPFIDHTFRLAGLIHPDLARESEENITMTAKAFEELMVGAIGEDNFEVEGSRLPPFPISQKLNN